MQEKEFVLPGGSLYYEIKENEAVVTGWSGHGSKLSIPGYIEEYPVTVIGRRAFKSCKHLHKVSLPDTVEELGDWAFSYCENLEQITIPKKNLRLGRTIFMGCPNLRKVEIEPLEHQSKDTVELLAAALTFFNAYYLLDPENTGTPGWISNWDLKLLAVLRADDREEYSKIELCGEEEYSIYDIEAYLHERRKRRVRLLLLRLLNPIGLADSIKAEMEAYLLSHTKGCETEETWEVVAQEYGDERRYYELFAALGCITEENFDGILHDIGDEHSEMKAYFIRYKEEKIGYSDFFSGLSLDF